MKLKNSYIVLLLAGLLSFISCTDDEDVQDQEVLDCCVQMAWSNGRGGGETRTLTSFLTDVAPGDLALAPAEYPEEIALRCKDKDITLTRTDALHPCTEHDGFYNGYTSDYPLKDIEAKKGVTASAKLDDIDELYSDENDIVVDGVHLKITMHHSKALLRFGFKVDARYDQIRYIKLKSVTLNDDDVVVPCFFVEKVLNKDNLEFVAYAYLEVDTSKPNCVTTTTTHTIQCTYDIYDKDADIDLLTKSWDDLTVAEKTEVESHRTREAVIAENTFKLNNLKDASSNTIKSLQSGYYYDLRVTLNPDYLYVLSEHDNQHLTIN